MKILITGGSGFIGRNIKESWLKDKYEIFAPSRKELDCANDENVAEYFKKNSFDVIIHSAAKPGHRNAADTQGLLFTNSRMVFNLLKHKDSWGKLINIGSGSIYDMRHYIPKMKEEYFGTYIPADELGYCKYIMEKLFAHLDYVVDFRVFGIYGKYEDYAIRFISNAICKSLFSLPITLRQNRRFDYLYIDDLMPVLDYFILNKAKYHAYNITPDSSVGLLEIAQMVNETAGGGSEIKVGAKGMGMEYSGDNNRLRAEFKNVKFTDIETGIKNLYNWYLDNKASINKDLLLTDK